MIYKSSLLKLNFIFLLIIFILSAACGKQDTEMKPEKIKVYSASGGRYIMSETIYKTEEEWEKILTAEQFKILREKGTEKAFNNEYWNNHKPGIYECAGCGLDLFSSKDMFDSGTGWPSFTAPVAAENIKTRPDRSLFIVRTEVICARCGGHIGHVFDDGPKPTELRYCMNSAALKLYLKKKIKRSRTYEKNILYHYIDHLCFNNCKFIIQGGKNCYS